MICSMALRWQADFVHEKGSSPLARAVEVGVAHAMWVRKLMRRIVIVWLPSQVKNLEMIQLLLELRAGPGATGHVHLPECRAELR